MRPAVGDRAERSIDLLCLLTVGQREIYAPKRPQNSHEAQRAGKAVVFSTDKAAIEKWLADDAGGAVVWSTAKVRADNSDSDMEGAKRDLGMTLHGGSVFRVTELGPGFATPMHRTLSTDYCIVLSGTLELVLDGGETVRLSAGVP
jgi:hypothetical protein